MKDERGIPYRCIETIIISDGEDFCEYINVGDIVYRDRKHPYRFHVIGDPMIGSFTMYEKEMIQEHLVKVTNIKENGYD